MTYTTDIFTHNKVGIPVIENPKKIRYRNLIMTIHGEPDLIIKDIKYYWWKPDSLTDKWRTRSRVINPQTDCNRPRINAKIEVITYKDMLRKEGLINY